MKSIFNFAVIILLSFLVFSCNNNSAKDISESEGDLVHNSFNSLDFEGKYVGILPCADCEGIKTTLTLTREFDYKLETQYLGKSSEVFTVKGTALTMDNNTIALKEVTEGSNLYFIGEDYILSLDINGEKITGDLANFYVLKKVEVLPLYNLIELNGKAVTLEKSPNFEYSEKENRISGFAGCNRFFGSYQRLDENQVKTGPMASTMMACADENVSKTETEYLKMWDSVSSFLAEGDNLSLLDTNGSVLARFVKAN